MFEDAEKTRQHLAEIVTEIRSVLSVDLRDFPIRAAKKRYLALPEFAATITAEKLGELKGALGSAAEKRATQIMRTLEDEAIWIEDVTPSGNKLPKTLRDNRTVTEALSGIAEITHDILKDFGFPAALLDIHYDPPTWFINGKYLPGLIEKYWKTLAALRQQSREHKRAQHEHDVQVLAERWEDA